MQNEQTNETTLPQLMLDALEFSKKPLFELGRTVCTSNISNWADANLPLELLADNLWFQILITAHVTGCWENNIRYKSDIEANWKALEPGNEGKIMSVFYILDETIYVITEWDRSVTTVLLAEDY